MYSNKHIWNVSYPILLSLLAQNIINVTDTAFLGHVGEVELGASAMGGLFYICIFTIAFGFSTGSQIVIARRNGEKQYTEIGPVMIQGIIVLLITAFILFWLSRLFSSDIMNLLISSKEIQQATAEFIDWRIYGFFFSFVNVMFRAFYIGITKTKVLTVNAIVMALTNVLLDYILIFGKCGLPVMGIKGAAIASVIAEASSILFFVIYTYVAVNFKKYGLNRLCTFSFRLLKNILNISSFTMLQYFLSMTTWFLFFVVVERLGQRELAIANIVRSIYIVLLIPVNSLATTSNTLVSNAIGEGNIKQVTTLIARIARICFFIVLICVVIVLIFPQTILSIYTNEQILIDQSINSLYIISIAIMMSSFANIYFSGISGTGNTQAALLIEIFAIIIYTAYVFTVGLYFKAPVSICFATEIIYYTLLFIGSYLYLKKANWQKKKI